MKPIVVIDFDGVIHSYKQRWIDFDKIPDPPVPGAIDFLRNLIGCDKFQVYIHSSRNVPTKNGGREIDRKYQPWCGKLAMERYLIENGLEIEFVNEITFPDYKPPAHVTIDDRVICFTGSFPSIEEIENFKPWNNKDDAYEE
ncbi:hypothetical protein M0R19_05815 [Candidatus Pacearchaeota archaeon]|nr:hypothetical protein [Candidatus Pacearchaeota archaeon]